jgi:hypothetical protein
MNKQIFLEQIENGRIFSATFVKKDGTIRKGIFRRKVKKGVKGIGMSFNPGDKGLMIAYDMRKKAFRMINLKTLKQAKANGINFNL